MSLSIEDVRKRIATLARIETRRGRRRGHPPKLNSIFGPDRTDAGGGHHAGVEPMSHPQEFAQRLRDDAVTESDRRDAFQRSPAAVENGLYLVPKSSSKPTPLSPAHCPPRSVHAAPRPSDRAAAEMINASLTELARALDARKISSRRADHPVPRPHRALDPALNAFITVDPTRPCSRPRGADARIAAGKAGPLTGIPVAHKDIFCTDGWLTTCGSKCCQLRRPYDAT
jgi:aspartyl/glutamyl-tRNA(Asn/Gln) amidotransferase C subunit